MPSMPLLLLLLAPLQLPSWTRLQLQLVAHHAWDHHNTTKSPNSTEGFADVLQLMHTLLTLLLHLLLVPQLLPSQTQLWLVVNTAWDHYDTAESPELTNGFAGTLYLVCTLLTPLLLSFLALHQLSSQLWLIASMFLCRT
jgi:hypothetical protein